MDGVSLPLDKCDVDEGFKFDPRKPRKWLPVLFIIMLGPGLAVPSILVYHRTHGAYANHPAHARAPPPPDMSARMALLKRHIEKRQAPPGTRTGLVGNSKSLDALVNGHRAGQVMFLTSPIRQAAVHQTHDAHMERYVGAGEGAEGEEGGDVEHGPLREGETRPPTPAPVSRLESARSLVDRWRKAKEETYNRMLSKDASESVALYKRHPELLREIERPNPNDYNAYMEYLHSRDPRIGKVPNKLWADYHQHGVEGAPKNSLEGMRSRYAWRQGSSHHEGREWKHQELHASEASGGHMLLRGAALDSRIGHGVGSGTIHASAGVDYSGPEGGEGARAHFARTHGLARSAVGHYDGGELPTRGHGGRLSTAARVAAAAFERNGPHGARTTWG